MASELFRGKAEAAKGAAIATQTIEEERRAKSRAQAAAQSADAVADYWRDKANKAEAALAQKDELLKEWMHSNEAFKRLARKYGKKLGVSDEQRVNDYDDVVLEIAEEKPEFADTKTLKEVKEARGMK